MKHLELFAGIGGFRHALDLIQQDLGVEMKCVGFSEIDSNARATYCSNFHPTDEEVDIGDIVTFTSNKNNIKALPKFELLTGGFPCQTFSMMGSQLGFEDQDRGQMFFRILDILKVQKPKYILLENVKNLYNHDKGNTFKVIKRCLEDDLHPQGLTDSHKFLRYRIEQLGRFDDTWSCNKHLFHVAKVQKVLHSTKSFIRFYDYYSLFAQIFRPCSLLFRKKAIPLQR